MKRETEATLIEFCALQRDEFDLDLWLEIPHPDRDEFIAAVLFLAGVDWYGHRESLLKVAHEIAPGMIGHLSKVVQKTNFDLSRFSNTLRREIKHESVTRTV